MSFYTNVIIQAVFAFPFIAFLFTLPFMIKSYRTYGSFLSLRIIIVYSFILYLMCIYFLVILPLPSIESVAQLTTPRMQLIPFHFVSDIIQSTSFSITSLSSFFAFLDMPVVYQMLFNIAMTIPFGMYLHYYFNYSWKKTLLCSFLLSLFFELTQLSGLYFIYPRSYRLFDVDDLIVNTLGGMIGYVVMIPLMKVLPTRSEIDESSYHRGTKVSFFRRSLALFIDIVVISIFIIMFSNLFAIMKIRIPYLPLLLIALYFLMIPSLSKGYTLGKYMVNIRIIALKKQVWFTYLLRYGAMLLVLVVIPYVLFESITYAYQHDMLGINMHALLIGCLYAILLFYLLFAIIECIRHKPLFYERLSNTRIVSTVLERSDKELFSFHKMTQKEAKAIVEWCNNDDKDSLLNRKQRKDTYFSVYYKNQLAGFVGLKNSDNTITIQFQLQPTLSEQELTPSYMEAILTYVQSNYEYDGLSIMIPSKDLEVIQLLETYAFKEINRNKTTIHDIEYEMIHMQQKSEM